MATSDGLNSGLYTRSAKFYLPENQPAAASGRHSSHGSSSDLANEQTAPGLAPASLFSPEDVAASVGGGPLDAHPLDNESPIFDWNYSFEVGSLDFSFQVTTSTTAVNGVYTDLSISGTVGGEAITGLDPGAFGYADDLQSLSTGYFDGLDLNGVGFFAGGVEYNPYTNGSGTFYLEYGNGSFAQPTDVVFSTDAPACYLRGTRIATVQGEVAIEDLAVGDLLVTASGALRPLKWIGRRSYTGWLAAGNADVWPICFAPGSLADGVPSRELRVSPEHAMWLDGVLVPAALLVNGSSIVKSAALDDVQYYHLELDTHDIILAEGAPAESFVDDDSRGIFHNAADFYACHPDVPRGPAAFCAPRVEDGFELDAIRRRLAGRAKTLAADGTAAAPRLKGYLETVNRSVLEGWVMDRAAPDQRVSLAVFDNGAEIGRVVADRFRADLERAGIGDGKCSFVFYLPDNLAHDISHAFELRSAEGWVLPLHRTCAVLEPQDAASVAANGAARAEQDKAAQDKAGQAGSSAPSALRGRLDVVNRSEILGWALDGVDADSPVGLVASANGRIIGRVLANRFRRDLQSAGMGSGRHSFALRIPTGMLGAEAQEIRVTRELDGAELQGSPVHLPALRDLDTATEAQVSALFACLNDDAAEARGLALLARETRTLLERRAARSGLRAEREALARHCRRWGPAMPELPPEFLPAATMRALVIDLLMPCPGRDGGSVAILSHMRALAALGYAVSFAAAEDGGAQRACADLAQEGIAVCGQPYYAGVEDVLRLHAGGFDLIYLHRHECADRYLALARALHPKARIVYSVADLHHVRLARQSQVERRPELLAHSRRLAVIEAHAASRADVVLTHSITEAQVLRQVAGFGRVHVVPFAVGARPGSRRFAERRGLAFIGGFGHAPNTDAVFRLARDIMPLVWAQDPSITCRIAGHGWVASRLPELDPRIEILGPTEDLDGLLDTVRLTVAPLRFGAGIKAKVLDSFAAGVPCVMSGIAAEGLNLAGPLTIPVADDVATFAGHILRLHADQALNERIGAAAARLVADEFDQARVNEAMREALLAHRSDLDDQAPARTPQRSLEVV
jgi:glycosyltransferase involved in cell wall biosynthesis